MDYKKRKLHAVRDFPKGCCSHGRAVDNTLNNLLEAGELGLLNESESEETSVVASGEQRGTEMPVASNTEGLFGPGKTLKHEGTELSKKDVARVYPPRRRTPGSRCFPEGCGRNTSQSGNEVGANGLENAISCVEVMSVEERIKSNIHKSAAAVEILPRRGIAATRFFPENCRRKVPQAFQEVGEEALASKASVSISQCGRMRQSPGGVPTDWDRVIVIGLMASVKCPWRQAKGAQNQNASRGVAMGKRH